jgi:hypothetical protein
MVHSIKSQFADACKLCILLFIIQKRVDLSCISSIIKRIQIMHMIFLRENPIYESDNTKKRG